jgi:hypothetical protein
MKKILIWGTGKIANKIIDELKDVIIIGFIETEKSNDAYLGYKVFSIEELPSQYDFILIANSYTNTIYTLCKTKSIDLHKVCFVKKGTVQMDIDNNLLIAGQIMSDKLYSKICYEFGRFTDDWVSRDAILYNSLNKRETFVINELHNFYIYSDKGADAGSISSYFWQDLWAARKIYKKNPSKHYDIGSRVDGFISHLLSFRDNVYLIDIRPLEEKVDGLEFKRADATNLNEFPDNSIESISALCSLEHFGLGRYGDDIDPEACFKCFEAISRKVKSGGSIYISVPVGCEHIEFNAHRVFYASTIVKAFNECDLVEYSSTSKGCIEYNIDLHKYDDDKSLGGGRFGLFHFKKR